MRPWLTALALGLAALLATASANAFIERRFGAAARPDDLLFELLPYVGAARWLTVIALVAGFGLFVAAMVRHDPAGLPGAAAALAVLYLLRAGIMVLTPLAPAHGEGIFVVPPQQFGMFPSGHVAAVTLLALLAPAGRPALRRALWAVVGLMVAGMLLARGHYSIDIVGALLLAYFVAHSWRTGGLLAPLARATAPHRPAREPGADI